MSPRRSKKKLIVQPSATSSNKGVRFQDSSTTHAWSSSSRKRRKSRDIEESDEDPLVQVTFKELLRLNKPDWLLVVVGVVSSGLIGALFPLMSILFSSVLEVCYYK